MSEALLKLSLNRKFLQKRYFYVYGEAADGIA